MSEAIRSNLLAELKALQTQIKGAQQVLAEEPKDDLCVKLSLEKVHLEEAMKRIDELDVQWWSHIAKLEEAQRMEEEALYMNFPPRDAGRELAEGQEVPLKHRHFVDQCEFARQIIVLIAETMDDLVLVKESPHQSSTDMHSEESHFVDSNNNDRSENNSTNKPLLWYNPRFRHSQYVRKCRQTGGSSLPMSPCLY
ncbi:hypothetical protein ACQ4LE_008539 [Meloidogyne hapla]